MLDTKGRIGGTERRTENLTVPRIRPHAMDHRETKLSLGQVLAKALVVGILCRLEVHVVVSDLKVYRDEVDQGNVVAGS